MKYVSSAFEKKYNKLVSEGEGFEEDRDEYLADRIFYVPEQVRWDEIELPIPLKSEASWMMR